MRILSARNLIASSVAVYLATSVSALAQAASDGARTEAGSDEIIVTARRVEERLQDVPISITVYNQKQLDNRNISIATDLATYTPSLSVNQRYGPEKAAFAIRGFNQDNGTAPTVGVYFADVVGVRAQAGTPSGNTALAGSFMDLQNVQVLKGPQGTLFGRNTTGGAVLLVPQRPTDRLEGYVEGSLGNYDMRRIQGVLNVPLADTFKVRLSVDRQKRDGYMRNRSGIGAKSFNDINYFYARLSIIADLTPELENYTIFHYSDSDTNGYAGRLVKCDPTATFFKAITSFATCDQIARQAARGDGKLDVEVSAPNPFVKIKQWQAINTTTWQASDTLTVKNILSYGEYRENASFNLYSDNFYIPDPAPDLSAAFIDPLVPGTPFQFLQFGVTPGLYLASESTFTEELQLQGKTGDGRFTYVVGGYLEFSRPINWNDGRAAVYLECASVRDLQCSSPLSISAYNVGIGYINNARSQYLFDNHGIFAQGTFNITDQLALTLGGRYTFDKVKSVSEYTQIRFQALDGGFRYRNCYDTLRFANADGSTPKVVANQSECHYVLKNKSNKPTWLINLDYKPIPDVMLYAKYARGYRQGGLNVTNIGYEPWGPEKVDAYEIGAKTSFHGAVSGYFNVTAFYNDFQNQQITAGLTPKPGGAGAATIINAGKSRIQGIEVDAAVTLFESLRLEAGYTYLDTKVKELTVPVLPEESPFLGVNPTAAVGEPLPLSPKNRITLTGTYTLPLDSSIGEVSVGATFTHTDKQVANASQPVDLGVMPSTDLLNVNVNWEGVLGSPLDAAFFATNITNEIYPVNTGGGYTTSGVGDLLFGQPRMWGFRLKYHFGE